MIKKRSFLAVFVISFLLFSCNGNAPQALGPCTTIGCNCIYEAGECICEAGGFYCRLVFCPAAPGVFCICAEYVCIVGGICCDEGEGGCVFENVSACNCTPGSHCGNPGVIGPCGFTGCMCAVIHGTCICDPNDKLMMCGQLSANIPQSAFMSCCG